MEFTDKALRIAREAIKKDPSISRADLAWVLLDAGIDDLQAMTLARLFTTKSMKG